MADNQKNFEDVVKLLDKRSGGDGKVKEQLSVYKDGATRLAEEGFSFASQFAAIESLHDLDIAAGQAVYKGMISNPLLHIDLKKEHEISFAEQFAAAVMVYDTVSKENIYLADIQDIYDETRTGGLVLNSQKLEGLKRYYHKDLGAYCISDESGPEPYTDLRNKIAVFETGAFVASITKDTEGAAIQRGSGTITDPRIKNKHE